MIELCVDGCVHAVTDQVTFPVLSPSNFALLDVIIGVFILSLGS